MIYRIKAFVRWLRWSLRMGVSYHEYPHDMYGTGLPEAWHVVGWYEAGGKVIAFRNIDWTVRFLW